MAGDRRRSAGQLALPFDSAPSGRLPSDLPPMIATLGSRAFDDEDRLFEPWWPGTRAVAFVEDGRLRLQVDHLTDPLATFPELELIVGQLGADGVVLEGTLLVLDGEGRPDAELLRRRLADAPVSAGSGAFVASDLLWINGTDISAEGFEFRRARLTATLRDGERCVVSRGLRGEGLTLASAVASMGLSAISARRLDSRWYSGPAGDDWLRLPVTETPAPETRPLLVLLQRLPLDG